MSRAQSSAGIQPSAHPAWISPRLAAARSRSIHDLRYSLAIRIDAAARRAQGRQIVELDLAAHAARRELLLDWRPDDRERARTSLRKSVRINGIVASATAVRLEAGHLALAPGALRAGRNRIELAWQAPIAEGGTPIVRFRDPRDGRIYVHTLFVPAEASRVFPCFDQPDLKARFTLSLEVPADWSAIANAPRARNRLGYGVRRVDFAPTEPISTYVFAFAVGPFVGLGSRPQPRQAGTCLPQGRLWVRRSLERAGARDCKDVLALDAAALRFCARYFAHPFPFAKYDLVLIPQFAFRGMEHAGATFLCERDVLLDAPDALRRLERAQLVFHETAHQWLGDLVTMRTFADLWLKEGFANFVAYRLAARSVPPPDAEAAFLRLLLAARHVDTLPRAPAVHCPIRDAAHAKWVYGPSVYAKAPALLRELEGLVGRKRFRAGVRRFVRRFAFGAASWRDLIAALESTAGGSLEAWARARILRASPTPLATAFEAGSIRAVVRSPRMPPASGIAWPAALTGDPARVAARIAALRTPMRRLAFWESAWQALRAGTLTPHRLIALALSSVAMESNAVVLQLVLQRTAEVMDRLLEDPGPLAAALDEVLVRQLHRARTPLTPIWLEALAGIARSARGLATLEQVARGRRTSLRFGGLEQRRHAAIALIARGAWSRAHALRELGTDGVDAAARLHFAAATPQAERKRTLLARLLARDNVADSLLLGAVETLNHPAHAALTCALLPAALQALPRLADRRAVFFAERWIAAFAGGQASMQAAAVFDRYAREPAVASLLANKLLQAACDIRIAAAIRSSKG